MTITRRTAIFGIGILPFAWRSVAAFTPRDADLARLERTTGGRLGIAILDTGSGERASHRDAERFPMCSTFKLLAIAAVLARVDQRAERLDRRISFTKADLLEYAPATTARVGQGSMTVAELCEAAMTLSDNTAANLLLASLGGPSGVTTYARSLGDSLTRLDRKEPELNEGRPGDSRDTTTPAAMLANLQRLLLGDALSHESRARLIDWLARNQTGAARLRAGLPGDWRVGDKTGTGSNGITNDIGILWPPKGTPILVTVYLTESPATAPVREGAIAEVARLIARYAKESPAR